MESTPHPRRSATHPASHSLFPRGSFSSLSREGLLRRSEGGRSPSGGIGKALSRSTNRLASGDFARFPPPSLFSQGGLSIPGRAFRTAWVSLPLRESLPRGRPFHLPNLEVIRAPALCHPSFSSSPPTPSTAVALSRTKKTTTIAFSIYRQNGWQHYYVMRT